MAELTTSQVLEAGLDDWRQLAQRLHARFLTGSFSAGLEFVTAVTNAAEAANHHPDVTLSYPHVDLALISHDVGRLTKRDLSLAREISSIARAQQISADPSGLSVCEIGLDTADFAKIGPFWAVLLTGDPKALDGAAITDPSGRVPTLWFQQTEPHATPRQRFHVDLWLPPDVAETRVEAAVSAGGTVVERTPTFVVLADSDGNQACVCTTAGR